MQTILLFRESIGVFCNAKMVSSAVVPWQFTSNYCFTRYNCEDILLRPETSVILEKLEYYINPSQFFSWISLFLFLFVCFFHVTGLRIFEELLEVDYLVCHWCLELDFLVVYYHNFGMMVWVWMVLQNLLYAAKKL